MISHNHFPTIFYNPMSFNIKKCPGTDPKKETIP